MPSRPDHLLLRSVRGIAQQYRGRDTDAVMMRSAHMRSVMRMTPQLAVGKLGCVGMVMFIFRDQRPAGMGLWAAATVACALLAMLLWFVQRRNRRRDADPGIVATHVVSVMAALCGLCWASLTLGFYDGASGEQRLLIGLLLCGLLGVGSLILAPMPLANASWCAVIGVGACVQSLEQTGGMHVIISLLSVVYSVALQMAGLTHWLKSTLLLRARSASLRHERVLTVLLEDFEQQAGDALWQVDVDGRLTHLSPRLSELLGVPEDELRGVDMMPVLEGLSPGSAERLRQTAREGRPFRELPITLQAGDEPRHLSMSGKPMYDENGRLQGWRGVLADVTTQVEHERRLHFQASTDALTGLANRYTLREQLQKMVEEREAGVLLCLDLDHFKNINDSLGHSAGDHVLKEVARRLLASVRADDLVARLGGDEFAIVLRGLHPHAALMMFADRLVATIGEPLALGEQSQRCGASVGIVRLGESQDVDELLAQADMALYASKDAGRGRHALYDQTLGDRNRRRLAMEAALRQAAERGELRLAWQPKVDVASWTVTGAEALLRWDHPELGRGGPAEFIGVAERGGMIGQLGDWALREACRAGSQELRGLCVAVNVSPLQFMGGHFVAQVREALSSSGLEPQCLELEITESVFMDDPKKVLRQLHELRALGVRIALDDFGTGYSSLSYLRRFPFDTLKIDRSFVIEMASQPDAHAIVRMIAELATTLGMHTVCEGVETAEQLAVVRSAGCHEIQGYLVAAPTRLADLQDMLARWPGSKPPAPASRRAGSAPTASLSMPLH